MSFCWFAAVDLFFDVFAKVVKIFGMAVKKTDLKKLGWI
jgi:hypothetical protein